MYSSPVIVGATRNLHGSLKQRDTATKTIGFALLVILVAIALAGSDATATCKLGYPPNLSVDDDSSATLPIPAALSVGLRPGGIR